ncbi:MAG: glutamine--fructose-6-phosphate transaminase (isomerizing) [Maricaulaceae bacterium]|jgi:glucosamine--fructose-6-phosphate aminotransferase (isomerizing)
MCGIIAIASHQPTSERLIEGLKRLEYRGYDSAGIAVVDASGELERRRAVGKVTALEAALAGAPVDGVVGVAHTRWATHGAPTETNAHPHRAGRVVVVHNGIIENFARLRAELERAGRSFSTQTDTEVVAHLIDQELVDGRTAVEAFRAVIGRLEGAFALAVLIEGEADLVFGARRGSPLVVGISDDEAFLGSDAFALAPFTNQVIYLEEGDWSVIRPGAVEIYDHTGAKAERPLSISSASAALAEKGPYRHFMEKEIYEQPEAIAHTLSRYVDPVEGRTTAPEGLDFARANRMSIIACGTACYAGQIAKYWFEDLAGLGVESDVASEYRYRSPVLQAGDIALAISQSGETADTKAAFEMCKAGGLATGAIVNVQESTIARLADTILPTLAGPEIGVASTKAFTSQLAVLAALSVAAARARGRIDAAEEARRVGLLQEIPRLVSESFGAAEHIRALAHDLAKAKDVLYLGRGPAFPLALEGALKLKEISYIHAEGYAAGELKHGPIALIDEETPIVVIAPRDHLFEKTVSSMQEVAARGGKIVLITDRQGANEAGDSAAAIIQAPTCDPFIAPIVFAPAVQLLAYHIAVEKGTDVDQPRNLAKSVTVE